MLWIYFSLPLYNHKEFDLGHTWMVQWFSLLQFKSEFGNKEFMIWATASSWSCFCWLYRTYLSSTEKNIINQILVLTSWWCSWIHHMKCQAWCSISKTSGKNINNLRCAESEYGRKCRVTKEHLDEGERGEWKSWLKAQHWKNKDHGIWSHHFMVNRWGNNGNSERLYLLGLQNHCRRWLKPWN